jgi:hypothetical protein
MPNFADRINKNTKGFIAYFLLLSLSLVGIITLQSQAFQKTRETLDKSIYLQQENSEEKKLQVFKKIPSLGFANLIADWLYLRFIQYFGDSQARETIGYRLSPNYFLQIANRDPRFVDAMLRLDTATSIFAGYPETSVKTLETSINSIPKDQFQSPGLKPYYLTIYKGIDQLLFLGKPQAAAQSYQQASEWAKQYNDEESKRIATNTARTAQFLARNPDSKVMQIGAWAMVLSNNSDSRTVKRALTAIQALGGEIITNPDGSATVRVPLNIK